jgi:hypothetical protein
MNEATQIRKKKKREREREIQIAVAMRLGMLLRMSMTLAWRLLLLPNTGEEFAKSRVSIEK